MAPIRTKLCQNAFRMIPDISFFDGQQVEFLRNFQKFPTAIYPPRMARIGLKLGQNAFQTIHFIFRRPESRKFAKIFKIPMGRLPPEDGSDRPQTWPKRVSDDPQHFIFRRRKHFFSDYRLGSVIFVYKNGMLRKSRYGLRLRSVIFKFRTAVYPPRMAPIGSKLCQNAFQVIPDVSFFDAKNKKNANFEGPFTPRGWLRLARNLAKIRFR